MYKISIIAPVGTSPPIITEFLQYVDQVLEQRVTDVTVIATREPMVQESVELVKVAVKRRYPHTHLHLVELPFTDISSQEDSLEFMNVCAKTLRDQRTVHRVDMIYLCVAGGRKDMCITLSLLGQYFGVNGVFHIIMPDVKSFSIEIERRRHEITELAKADDKGRYYEAHQELFDAIMYPPPSAYTVIKIPVVPYPKPVLNEMGNLLRRTGALDRASVHLSLDILQGLEASGLIKATSRRIYVTDDGRRFAKALEAI